MEAREFIHVRLHLEYEKLLAMGAEIIEAQYDVRVEIERKK